MTTDAPTLRDSVLDALRTKKPQRDQFMPLCFFDYFTPMPGYSDAANELEFRANFYESIGATFMDWCGGNAYTHERDSSVTITTAEENDGLRAIETFTTPVGELTQVVERRPDLNAGFIVKPMLETEDDLRVYRYILEAETTVATPEAAQRWLDTVGGRGIAMQPGCNQPFHRLMYSFGPEKFLIMAMEGLSAAVLDLFPLIHEKGLAEAKILADSPIQVINHHRIDEIRHTVQEIRRVLRAEGYLFVTVGTDRHPPRPGAPESVEVEPHTYVPLDGHEKGVPHHDFDMNELLGLLVQFHTCEDTLPIHKDSRGYTCVLWQKPAKA